MAIIQCPVCRQRISSLQAVCPHCEADLKSGTASAHDSKRYLRDRLYRARMGGYVALSVMMLAVLIWWVPSEGVLVAPAGGLKLMFLLGAVGYIASRYFLVETKRSLRRMDNQDG